MDDPLPRSPYKTLNVPKDATLATIRSAHRKLVLSCHPDKVQDESAKKVKAEQFHQVQQAYEILSDERRRQRYDEKVKLDELRVEMESERVPPMPRRAPTYDYGPPRGGPPPMTEMRGDRLYETREPPKSNRYSDEEYPQAKYDIRTPNKRYDDYYPNSSGRRTSGRATEEKKKARDIEDDRDRRRREREAEAVAREQRSKKRDKDRKKGTETKSRSKFSSYVDDGSDSELDERRYPDKRDRETAPKYKYEELPRRSRDEPRKNSKYDSRSYDEELNMKLSAHQEHINRSREAVEVEPARRSARNSAPSNIDSPKITSPLPVSSDKRPSPRRAYGSRQPSPVRSTKKDRRSPDINIVEPPASRKSSLPSVPLEPKGIKSFFSSSKREPVTPRREPTRSATYQPSPDSKQPAMRRSETAPIDRTRPGNAGPLKSSSNLRNMKAPSDYSDSSTDSDSEMTDDVPPLRSKSPRHKSTSYRVHEQEDKFKLEPEIFPARPPRDSSPKSRRSSDRPMAPRSSTTTRIPPMPRASSYAFPQDDRSPRPGFSRTESARPTPLKTHQSPRNDRLFMEQSPTEDNYKVRSSSKVHTDGTHYAKPYSRGGSVEVDRDAYPGSSFHSHRPRMGRHETTYC